MANKYQAPGMYVQERSTLPGFVVEVRSAVPAFIGYTEKTRYDGRELRGIPECIASFKGFKERFGAGPPVHLDSVLIKTDERGRFSRIDEVKFKKRFLLYEALDMYFANGGGECYVVSTGNYADNQPDKPYDPEPFTKAIDSLNAIDDITLLVMPEAALLGDSLYGVQQAALKHCADRQNRFAILDLIENSDEEQSMLLSWKNDSTHDYWLNGCDNFRNRVGIMNLSYGAVYTPYIIADTKPSLHYRDLRDELKEPPTSAATSAKKLELAALDPGAEEAINHLQAAIDDMSNLLRATEIARGLLTKPVALNEGESLLSLSDFIVSFNTRDAEDEYKASIAETGRILGGMFTSLSGESASAAELTYTNDPLTAELSRHLLDMLKQLQSKLEALVPTRAAASDAVADIMTGVPALIAQIPSANLQPLASLIDTLLGEDLHQSIISNVARLSDDLYSTSAVYRSIFDTVQKALKIQPPSAAMAGLYAKADRARGVWKAPANISLSNCLGLTQTITAPDQDRLNIDLAAGKSINSIRSFPGKGYLVWGARTLDGNSQEWRYIPVRRFFIMVKESVRRSISASVFEPNDANLWSKTKGMIDNYLIQKWRNGALAGASPADAFFVNVGLGSTMTAQDILEGRLIVDIGLALVKPAEFITMRFMHKMQQS